GQKRSQLGIQITTAVLDASIKTTSFNLSMIKLPPQDAVVVHSCLRLSTRPRTPGPEVPLDSDVLCFNTATGLRTRAASSTGPLRPRQPVRHEIDP
ncbi:hypothetical protein OC834_007377, partial [Tilletia horrida]